MSYKDIDSVGGSLEVGLFETVSGLVQVEWERSLLRRLDDDHASSDQVLIWFGGRVRPSTRWELEFAVMEDIRTRVSPDITFHVGMKFRF